jgi:hypothetical protein
MENKALTTHQLTHQMYIFYGKKASENRWHPLLILHFPKKVSFAASNDNGQTFGTPIKISNASSLSGNGVISLSGIVAR